jgi:anti-sigma factor RsiW
MEVLMRDDDRLDLSALDSARDPATFERLVQRTLAQARAAPPPPVLVRWSKPLLAASVVVMVSSGLLAWLPHRAETSQSLSTDTLSQWALTGEVPRDVDLGSFGVSP